MAVCNWLKMNDLEWPWVPISCQNAFMLPLGKSASGNISPTSGKQFPTVTSTPVIICILYRSMWTGNDIIHVMTYDKHQQLRVDLTDWEGNHRYAEYDNFKVGCENTKYKLYSVGKYSGNAGRYERLSLYSVFQSWKMASEKTRF